MRTLLVSLSLLFVVGHADTESMAAPAARPSVVQRVKARMAASCARRAFDRKVDDQIRADPELAAYRKTQTRSRGLRAAAAHGVAFAVGFGTMATVFGPVKAGFATAMVLAVDAYRALVRTNDRVRADTARKAKALGRPLEVDGRKVRVVFDGGGSRVAPGTPRRITTETPAVDRTDRR